MTPLRVQSERHFCDLAACGVPLATLLAGLRAVDVARLSGVSQSTLSRLWGDPHWIERVEGTTLSQLMAVSPSVGNYARKWGENQRLDAAVHKAESAGVNLRRESFAALAQSAPTSTVITLLSAVTEMLQGHNDTASRMFASSWGQRNNGVVDVFLASGPTSVFEDVETILKSVERFVIDPPGFADVAQVVGYGVLEHKLVKSGRIPPPRQTLNGQEDTLAFLTRSVSIARILSSEDDLSFVDWYRDRVFTQQDLMAMDLWSHATYSQDISLRQRRVPKATSLVSTAAMTVADIRGQNDAYKYYLLMVTLPLLLRRDPYLAHHHPSIVSALRVVVEDERTDNRIRSAAEQLSAAVDPAR